MKMFKKCCLALVAAAALGLPAFAADDYITARAVIQASSTVSDGKYAISEIADAADKAGIDIAVITDRDMMKWQYGLWPLRKIIKMTVEQGSVFKYGPAKYLAAIASAQASHPGMALIPGIESAPFYYWAGSVFSGTLGIYDWHKHLVIVGLDTPAGIKGLPIIGNPSALTKPFRAGNLAYALLPVVIIGVGLSRMRSRMSRSAMAAAAAFIVIGIALFANKFPFLDVKFDAYGGRRGIMPYQNMIDYANGRGALVFWAHVEASNEEKIGSVLVRTDPYVEYLAPARDYTGFCIFPDTYESTGMPGGVWDGILNEYCDGSRKQPIWAVAGMAYDRVGRLEDFMSSSRTYLLVRWLDRDEAMEAMRVGRMYAARGKAASSFRIAEFSLKGAGETGNDAKAVSGEELSGVSSAVVRIAGDIESDGPRDVNITIIKGGMVVKTIDAIAPFDVEYRDEIVEAGRTYYRVEIRSKDLLVVTNPIFLRGE